MPRVNASIPVRKIAAGSDTYKRGYHKGDPGGLDAIDSDLATANIKSGIVIFGKSGSADVRDIGDADAVVGDVKNTKTFYAVSGGKKTGTLALTGDADEADVKSAKTFYKDTFTKKTGTLATVALAPGSSAYPAGYHAGNGGGLPAIDADLAAGNIKKDTVIFGITGTFENTLAEDALGEEGTTITETSTVGWSKRVTTGAGGDTDLATKILTFAAVSRAVAVGYINADAVHNIKMQLIMGGVLAAESGTLPLVSDNFILVGTRALSGEQTCILRVHNYTGGDADLVICASEDGGKVATGIGIGSIKI